MVATLPVAEGGGQTIPPGWTVARAPTGVFAMDPGSGGKIAAGITDVLLEDERLNGITDAPRTQGVL